MSHFLGQVLKPGKEDCVLVNERTGGVVASRIESAFDSKSRNRGLLGRDGLPDGHAFILAPCNSIHTWFMRFPIDVAFVARDGRVVKVVERLRAWRIAVSWRAFATVELAAGTLARRDVIRGDCLSVRPAMPGTAQGS